MCGNRLWSRKWAISREARDGWEGDFRKGRVSNNTTLQGIRDLVFAGIRWRMSQSTVARDHRLRVTTPSSTVPA